MGSRFLFFAAWLFVSLAHAQGDDGQEQKSVPFEIISTSPHILAESDAGNYFADASAADGAKVFFAHGDGKNVSPLLGAGLEVVLPYRTSIKQENLHQKTECVRGSLDIHMHKKKAPGVLFWKRPSASVYGQGYVTVNKRLPSNFLQQWAKTHNLPESFPNTFTKAASGLSTIPWNSLLDQKTEPKGASISSRIAGRMNVTPTKAKGETYWFAYAKRLNKRSKYEVTEPNWQDRLGTTLNQSEGTPNGSLFLTNAANCTEDYPLKPKYAGSPVMHFVPMAAKVRVVSEDGETIPGDPDPAKILIISDNERPKRDCYVIALCCDWDNRHYRPYGAAAPASDEPDAFPINRAFSASGGINDAKLLPKPEYSRVPRSCFAVDTRSGSIRWKGGAKPIRSLKKPANDAVSAVAFPANQEDIVIKAVVALPAEADFSSVVIKAKGKQGMNAKAPLYPGSTDALSPDMEMASLEPLLDDKTGDPVQSIPLGEDGKPYSLYVAKMKAAQPFLKILRMGITQHYWYFYHKDDPQHFAFDSTLLPKVFTLIGDTTWPVSGDWQSKPSSYDNAVLLWSGVCEMFFAKMFSEESRCKARETKNINMMHTPAIAPDCDNYRDTPKDFRAAMAIGLYLATERVIQSENGRWQGLYSDQYQSDGANILHLSRIVADTNRGRTCKVLCFEAAFTLEAMSRLVGDWGLGVYYEEAVHAWNRDAYRVYDIMYDEDNLPRIIDGISNPVYGEGLPHGRIKLK